MAWSLKLTSAAMEDILMTEPSHESAFGPGYVCFVDEGLAVYLVCDSACGVFVYVGERDHCSFFCKTEGDGVSYAGPYSCDYRTLVL